jgi:caffeoyl-CoA O-methyltransferase
MRMSFVMLWRVFSQWRKIRPRSDAMSTTTTLLTGALVDYFATHAYREHPLLAALRSETAKLGGDSAMQIAPEQGGFMALLAKLMGAREIIEFGTFTGYSALAMALAADARLTCIDVSAEWTAIAKHHWEKAGVARRINLHLDGGSAAIARLLGEGRAGTFDMCFIDADKVNYDIYYEGALELLRPGGLIMIDNVLWGGDVADASKRDEDTRALRALNAKIKSDARVDFAMVPIGDGLTLARKL